MNNKGMEKVYINQSIKFPKVLCIDHNNVNLGVIATSQALALAIEHNLDLVQVGPPNRDRIPTCKILNYGKYKYELSKKKKETDRKQRESVIKEHEIKFRPSTDSNDLKVKAKKAEEFLAEGDRLRVTIAFKGREVSHKEVALRTLNEFVGMIPNAQFANPPSMEGKMMTVFVVRRAESTTTKV
jgi:translation initiation factor IF-3